MKNPRNPRRRRAILVVNAYILAACIAFARAADTQPASDRNPGVQTVVKSVLLGTTLFREGHVISACVGSPGGKFIASYSGGTVRLWDPVRGIPLRDVKMSDQKSNLNNSPLSIMDIATSPDGHYLAAAISDGSLCVWDEARKTLRGPIQLPGP